MDQTSEGTNWGRSEAHSHSATHGTGTTESTTRTDSKEVRLDPAVLKSEFLHLDDPSATDHVAGYFLAPAYSPWKAEIPFPTLAPRLERPDAEALTRGFVPWPDQEAVSKIKPWTADDYKRLHIDDPQLSKRKKSRRSGKDSEELPADFDF
jgi:hypothetical protein